MNLQPFAGGPPSGVVLNARGTPLYGGAPAPIVAVGRYTGNGSSQSVRVGFAPDLLMIKGAGYWFTMTAVGLTTDGAHYIRLWPQAKFQSSAQAVTARSANGFTVGTLADVNANGATFTYYAFKYRRGFIHATPYTGNGSNPRNISHNLGAVPDMMILSDQSDNAAFSMAYLGPSMGANAGFRVAMTNAFGAADATWLNNTAPTSSVFTVGSALFNTNTRYITNVLFASDNKNSKLGAYTGDGAANGATISLPFRPKVIFLKRPFTVLSEWAVFDNVNNTSSPWTKWFGWDGTGTQNTDANGVIVSGSSFRPPLSYNATGIGYAYMAFG
jgi:hypothetical protein